MEKRAKDDGPLDGIEIGHVHLRVSDLGRSAAFYKRVLGLEITHRTASGGVFLGASGGSGQIGLNTSVFPVAPSPGPSQFSIRYPDRPGLARALNRATAGGATLDAALDHGTFDALYIHDPDGNVIELYCEKAGTAAADANPPTPLDVDALRAQARAATGPTIAPALRERLREVRLRLLDLHKVLLDDAKVAYELDRGRIPSNLTLLQLAINDPWFAWLHPLSELVVRIDVALQPDGAATDADGIMLLEQVERLLSPAQGDEPFAQRYYEALQRQPAVITAHGDVRRVLKQAK
jgi:catechol 2,3-dioxygenase-like lactoylglutathione lyase family enzyme